MFKATHKIIGNDTPHFFGVGEEVQYVDDCEEWGYKEDVCCFVDAAGLYQHVLMSDVKAI